MSQAGSLSPKIRFLGQNMCSVACVWTDGHTHRQTHTHMKVKTEEPFQGSRNFSLNLLSRIGSKNNCCFFSAAGSEPTNDINRLVSEYPY